MATRLAQNCRYRFAKGKLMDGVAVAECKFDETFRPARTPDLYPAPRSRPPQNRQVVGLGRALPHQRFHGAFTGVFSVAKHCHHEEPKEWHTVQHSSEEENNVIVPKRRV